MKNKGFTLVELLAVIILIGLIAVITIPKIKDSLDDSKQKIAEASAVNYSKQIDKLVLEEKMKNNSILLDGDYNIDSNGNIYNEENEYVIDVSGKKPTGGTLTFSENDLQSGCITVNKYAVTIVNGEVTNTVKGNCEYQNIEDKLQEIVDAYVKAVLIADLSIDEDVAYDINNIEEITTNKPKSGWIRLKKENAIVSVVDYSLTYGNLTANYSSFTNGNYVSTFGNARNKPTIPKIASQYCYGPESSQECFKVFAIETDKVLLISKRSLIEITDNTTNPTTVTYRQTTIPEEPTKIEFSSSNYWVNNNELVSKYSNNGRYELDPYDGGWIYTVPGSFQVYPYVYDTQSNTYEFIEGYLTTLKSEKYNLPSTITGRLLKRGEAETIRHIFPEGINPSPYGSNFWLGTAYNSTSVDIVSTMGQISSFNYKAKAAVRPVIEIPISDFCY